MFETRPASVASLEISGADIYLSPAKCRCISRQSNLFTLTDRQVEVLKGLADGLSNKEIGRRLAISHFTVRNYVSRLLHLLNQPNRAILRQSEIDQSMANMTVVKLAANAEARSSRGMAAEGHRNAAQRPKSWKSAGRMKRSLRLLAIKSAIADGSKIGITLKIGDTVVSGYLSDGTIHFPGLGITFDVATAGNKRDALQAGSEF